MTGKDEVKRRSGKIKRKMERTDIGADGGEQIRTMK